MIKMAMAVTVVVTVPEQDWGPVDPQSVLFIIVSVLTKKIVNNIT